MEVEKVTPMVSDLIERINQINDKGNIVIDDLNNWKARQLWKKIVADERATITFDLYYLGIVMVVDKRYKINYKVNF